MTKLKLLSLALLASFITLSYNHIVFAEGANLDESSNITPADETQNLAQIGDTTYSSLEAAIEAAEPGSTIDLLADFTTTSPISIDKSLTINGNNHQISATLTDPNAVLHIDTSDQVTIQNLNLTTNTRGVTINTNVHHVTLSKVNMTVGVRGIHTSQNNNHSSTITVEDCLIQKSGYTNYDQEVPGGDYRGISIWQYTDSTISLKDTTIQGFSYVININPDNFKSTNLKIDIDNCILKGRAGLNVWTAGATINIKNSEILGINNFGGSSESFANIVVNTPAQVTLNIDNTKFTNYQNEVGLPNENALQHAISLRSNGNIVNISGNTSVTDTTGKLEDIFTPYEDSENTITITGGTYDYDVSTYVPAGYKVVNQNGRYTVVKSTPSTPSTPSTSSNVEVILPPTSNKDFSLQLDQSASDILKQSFAQSDLLTGLTSTDNITISPELEALDSNKIPASTQAQIATVVKNDLHLAQYFDLSIIVRKDGKTIGNLSELTSPLEFSLKLPTDLLKPGRKFYIVRLHDNKIDLLNTQLTDDILTFKSDKFSTYALAYTDNTTSDPANPSTPSDSSNSPSSPNTGLLTHLTPGGASAITALAVLGIISLTAGYAAYLAYRHHTK